MGKPGNAAQDRPSIDVSPEFLAGAIGLPTFEDVIEKGWYTDNNLTLRSDIPTEVFSYKTFAADGQNLRRHFNRVSRVIGAATSIRTFLIHKFLNVIITASSLLAPSLEFVATVGALQFLMMAPYEIRDHHCIYAKKFRGVWFLSEYLVDARHGPTKYADYLFRLLHTAGRPTYNAIEQAPTEYFRHTRAFRVMVAQIGDFNVLYSGEIHCRDSSGLIQLVTKSARTGFDVALLAHTYAWLMALSQVVVGTLKFCNGTVILHHQDYLTLRSVSWSPDVCFRSLSTVLQYLRTNKTLKERDVYELRLDCNARTINVRRAYWKKYGSLMPKDFRNTF